MCCLMIRHLSIDSVNYTGMDKLVCTPASNSLIACPGGTVSRLYRHIRQAAIPARVVLGMAVF